MPAKNKKRSKPGRSSIPLILVGIGLLVISVGFMVASRPDPTAADPQQAVKPVPAAVEYPAPDLLLSDLSGGPVSLAALRGQVVLVNNWATWCPPCRAEMPVLQAYAQAHSHEDFVLVGINAGDPGDQVADFVREYRLTFPVWLDPSSQALRAFQNNALPSSYVIDKTGTVRLVWMGAVTLEALEAYITPLLAD
jgi:thiol-disulfide isomerase/thioredoxin